MRPEPNPNPIGGAIEKIRLRWLAVLTLLTILISGACYRNVAQAGQDTEIRGATGLTPSSEASIWMIGKRDGQDGIWRVRPDGSLAELVTGTRYRQYEPEYNAASGLLYYLYPVEGGSGSSAYYEWALYALNVEHLNVVGFGLLGHTDFFFAPSIAFTPDFSRATYTTYDIDRGFLMGFLVLGSDGTKIEERELDPGVDSVLHTAISPDGRRVACAADDMEADRTRILIIDTANGSVTEAAAFDGIPDNLLWSRDGRVLFYSTENSVRRLDPENGSTELAAGMRIATGSVLDPLGNRILVQYTRDDTAEVGVLFAESGVMEFLFSEESFPEGVHSFRWVDDNWIVFDSGIFSSSVWTFDLERATLQCVSEGFEYAQSGGFRWYGDDIGD